MDELETPNTPPAGNGEGENKQPVVADKAPAGDGAGEGEGKEGEAGKETPPKAEDKTPKRDRVQDRINEITKSRRIAEADAGRVREVLKGLTGEEPPKPSDFKKPEEYTAAFMEYATKVKIPEAQLKDAEARVAESDQEYVQTLVESWDDKIEAEKAADPDWEKTVKGAKIKSSPEVNIAIMESPYGPKIVKYLAMNPDEAREIMSLSVSAQVRRIGNIESKVQATAPKEVAPKEKERPNDPPDNSVKGKGPSGAKDPVKMSMADYRKFRGLDK